MATQEMCRDSFVSGAAIIVTSDTFLAKAKPLVQALRRDIVLGDFEERIGGAGLGPDIEKILDQSDTDTVAPESRGDSDRQQFGIIGDQQQQREAQRAVVAQDAVDGESSGRPRHRHYFGDRPGIPGLQTEGVTMDLDCEGEIERPDRPDTNTVRGQVAAFR
jgi:hypothetical protein